MARVAGCPKCSHELFVPDEALGEAWAKCPQCRSFFQVKEAASREVPAVLLVDAVPIDANDAELRSATTLTDLSSSATVSDSGADDFVRGKPETLSGETVVIPIEPEQSDDELAAAANRIDEWFRSAKEAVDTPAAPADEPAAAADEPANDTRSSGMTTNVTTFFDSDALGDAERSADYELEETPEPSPAAWDNANETGQRLAEGESPRATEFAPVDHDAASAPAHEADFTGDEPDKASRSTGMTTNATVFFDPDTLSDEGPGADFELEESPEQSPAAWDDTREMGELLAEAESPRGDEFAPVDNSAEESEDGLSNAPPALAFPTEFTPDSAVARSARRRKRSPVRMLVMILLGGVVGVAGGYYALLWIRGPSLDFLKVAPYLPQAMLPASFKPRDQQLAVTTPPSAPPAVETAPADEPDESAALATAVPDETADETPEIQASYTTTEEPPADPASAQDDRYAIDASEPEPTDVQPQEPDAAAATGLTEVPEDGDTSASPADAVRIANAPTFTADELSAALEEAKKLQPALASGNFADGKEVKRAKGFGYAALADLAQKSAFVEMSAPSDITGPLQQATEELFRQTLSDAHTRSEVELIFPMWLASRNRKHGGVFFAANIARAENKGSVTECRAELEGGEPITLLVPAAAAEPLAESFRPMAVVGWVVDQPAEQVSGYTGDAPQAIWASKLIALE